jgi:hypothetical protein
MINSHIFLTQTHVETIVLQRQIAYCFHTLGSFDLGKVDFESMSADVLNEHFESGLNTQQVITMDFTSKSDYRDTILSLYHSYKSPTVVFLGNLNSYSTQLQEGMLRLLEEPPENLFVVLFAHNQREILPTIISRSQIHLLPDNLVMKILDKDLAEKVKKRLPSPGDSAKEILADRFDFNTISDFSKLERNEIDFWLWQVGSYITAFYKQNQQSGMGNAIQKILEAQKLNNQNSLKKFVFAHLSL